MRPYWIKTDQPMTRGYGVTARSTEDALELLRVGIPGEYAIIEIMSVDNIELLDQGHVVPNMGNILRRGIWFPIG